MGSFKGSDPIEAGYLLDPRELMGETMPSFFFRVQVSPESQAELAEVSAPDLLAALEALSSWRPGIHRVELEGVWAGPPGHA
ncbi:MAG: hypothetical protein ACE5K9_11730 [Candidatus Methylomirabilales bacterium]